MEYDSLRIKVSRFNFFEPKIGRYTYDPIYQAEFKTYLEANPIESFIDLDEPEYKHL